jgi:hypothetical protein
MSRKKIIISCVLLVIIATGIYAYREYHRTNVNLDSVTADYTLQATALANEFVANDSVADNKYRNKILAVQGVVKGVDKVEGDCTIVLGDTTDMAPSVRCILDSAHVAAGAAFKRGDKVVVKGAITGFKKDETGLLGSDVELNRCVVEKDKN